VQSERMRLAAAFLWLSLIFLYACLSGTAALSAEAKPRETKAAAVPYNDAFYENDNLPLSAALRFSENYSSEKIEGNTALSEASPLNQPADTESMRKHARIAYLTFDDGPSEEVTPGILDILKQFEVKGTFFVVGRHAERHPQIIKRIVDEGHALGNHSYSHKITSIYRTPQTLMADIRQCEETLEQITGIQTRIFRAPGGSSPYLKPAAVQALQEEGYTYFDWNVCPGDSDGRLHTAQELTEITLQQASNKDRVIILLHDSYPMTNTLAALPAIIEGLKKMGFVFEILTPETKPIHFPNHRSTRT